MLHSDLDQPKDLTLPSSPENQEEIPRVPWEQLRRAFKLDFQQGDHVSILGPTKGGKTTLGIEVCSCRDYVIFLATKQDDEIIDALANKGYAIREDLEIEIVDGKPRPEKIVFWPKPWNQAYELEEIHGIQKVEMRKAFTYVYHSGRWCTFADEVHYLNDELGMKRELNSLWYQGRSARNSLVASAQRPAWVPRAMYSAPEHLFMFQTNDRDDWARLGDIGGANVGRIKSVIGRLEKHEFLYVGTRTGVLLRSKVEL